MTLAHHSMPPWGRGSRLRTGPERHCGPDDTLAEVIAIRPLSSPPGSGFFGSLITMAREFASPRAQAALVAAPPRPPSSPAPLHRTRLQAAPDDAA